jgi:preprotein translocase subunit SecD
MRSAVTFLALLLAIGCTPYAQKAPGPGPRVALRLVDGPGAADMMTLNGENLRIERTVRFSEARAESINVEEDLQTPGRYLVTMRLDQATSEDFRRFTGDHVGRRLAVVVDGRLVAAPVIREAVTGVRIPILFDLSKEAADEAVASLRPHIGRP